MVVVDVGGEVREPMVVELEEGSRIGDAIEAAGGLTEEADIDGINRAAFVSDGDKILIPSKAETELSGGGGAYDVYGDGKINLKYGGFPPASGDNGSGALLLRRK